MAEGYEPNPSIGRHSLGIVKGTNIFDDYLASGIVENNTVFVYIPNLEFVTTVNISSLTNMMIYLDNERYILQNISDIDSVAINDTRIRYRILLPSQYTSYVFKPTVIRLNMTIEAS